MKITRHWSLSSRSLPLSLWNRSTNSLESSPIFHIAEPASPWTTSFVSCFPLTPAGPSQCSGQSDLIACDPLCQLPTHNLPTSAFLLRRKLKSWFKSTVSCPV